MRRRTVVTAVLSALAAGLVLAWTTIGQDRAFRRLMRQGDAALVAQDTSAAVAAYSGALGIQPDSVLARVKRGDAYRRRGELPLALADLATAATLAPTSTRARELLGDVHLELGHPAQAADAFRAYLALDDKAPRVLVKLATAELAGGHDAAARAAADRALALDSGLAEAHYAAGLAALPTDVPHAIDAFATAVKLAPALIPAREQLAAALLRAGRAREGVEALEAIAALEPAQPARAAAVVRALAQTGRFGAALARLTRAEEQFPGHRLLRAERAALLLDRAEVEPPRALVAEAQTVLEPLVTGDHPDGAALTAMGRARLLAGDRAGAVSWLSRAAHAVPVDPATLRLLARAALEAGDARAALDALIRHEAVLPGSAWAAPHARRIVTLAIALDDLPLARQWMARAEQAAPADPDLPRLRDALRHRQADHAS